MEFSFELIIDAPVKKVWALFYQVDRWHEWIPSIKKINIITSGPLRIGSKLEVKAKLGFFNITTPLTIIDFKKEEGVVMQGKPLFTFTNLKRFYYCKPENNKTKITIGGETSGLLEVLGAKKALIISKEIAFAAKNKIESTNNHE
jgi:ligand-binding SRPBCC domain-containing protein